MSSPAPAGTAVTPARRAAFEVVLRTFDGGAWTDRAFRSAGLRYELEGRERGLAQRLAYGAVQMRGTSDHLIGVLAERDPDRLDPPLAAALRLGVYELLFAGGSADHAVVNESVELAKRAGRGPAGLANAVLRRAAREGPGLLAALDDRTPAGAAVKHSHPEWIARLWWEELGAEEARALLRAGNVAPETALRVNTLRRGPEALRAQLGADGVKIRFPLDPGPLQLPETLVVEGAIGDRLAARIEAGELVPQARASAAVVGMLDPHPGERVLDLCAAPGIKTTQIAARLEGSGEVLAVERDPRRAAEAAELCARVGASNVRVEVGDAAELEPSAGYDRVLVDPPCSALGTLAQRPDARWRRSPGDPERLGAIQEAILRRGMAALRPGGTLAYATCTISRRESEDVVARALDSAEGRGLEALDLGVEHPELASPHDRRFLQTRPDRDRTSGFFIALLRREARSAGG